MPRSMWTGAISFGLVTVPVKLYSAIDRKTVRFHQLNGKSGVRIAQKRVDPQSGEEVPYEDIVKGYEIAKDRYVVIEPGELEALAPKKTKTIEIEDFVELAQIDPVYYDHPYYLAPGPGGAKPYRLLLEAMRRDRQGRDRARRDPLQGAARRAAPDGRRARDGDDDLRRRSAAGRTASTRSRRRPRSRRPSASSTSPSSSSTPSPATSNRRSTATRYREEVLDMIERKAQGEEIAVQPEPRGGRGAGARPDGRAEGQPRSGARARGRGAAKPKPAKRKAAAKKPQPRNAEIGGQEKLRLRHQTQLARDREKLGGLPPGSVRQEGAPGEPRRSGEQDAAASEDRRPANAAVQRKPPARRSRSQAQAAARRRPRPNAKAAQVKAAATPQSRSKARAARKRTRPPQEARDRQAARYERNATSPRRPSPRRRAARPTGCRAS